MDDQREIHQVRQKICHSSVFEQTAWVTVFLTSAEFVSPSQRRDVQLHLSVTESKLLKNTRVSLLLSSNYLRIDELRPSIKCNLAYCAPHSKLNFTLTFMTNESRIFRM